MYLNTPVQSVSMISAAVVCGYAFWRGERPERMAAAILMANWLGTPWLETPDTYHSLQSLMFFTDATTATLLLALALASNRFWPMWVTAFQALELLMHIAMAVDRHVHARAYFIGMEITSYLILAALAVGVWREAPRGRLMLRRASRL